MEKILQLKVKEVYIAKKICQMKEEIEFEEHRQKSYKKLQLSRDEFLKQLDLYKIIYYKEYRKSCDNSITTYNGRIRHTVYGRQRTIEPFYKSFYKIFIKNIIMYTEIYIDINNERDKNIIQLLDNIIPSVFYIIPQMIDDDAYSVIKYELYELIIEKENYDQNTVHYNILKNHHYSQIMTYLVNKSLERAPDYYYNN